MLSSDTGLQFLKPAEANAEIVNHAGYVRYEADARVHIRFACDRCCALSDKVLTFHFSHILVTTLPEMEEDGEYIEAPDYQLDTDSLLRDDILLELPSKLLCRESCKGLCPKCGNDLNVGACSCKGKEIDPRLAVLSSLLTD